MKTIWKKAVLSAKADAEAEQAKTAVLTHYKDRARDSILRKSSWVSLTRRFRTQRELMLDASVFQVILYTNYKEGTLMMSGILPKFCVLPIITIILWISKRMTKKISSFEGRFRHFTFSGTSGALHQYAPEGFSPDSLSLSTESPSAALKAYIFRMKMPQPSWKEGFSAVITSMCFPITTCRSTLRIFTRTRIFFWKNCRLSPDRKQANHILFPRRIKNNLYYSDEEVPVLRHYLSNIMAITKSLITHAYRDAKLPFAEDKDMIHIVEESNYLYEIMDFSQFSWKDALTPSAHRAAKASLTEFWII